MEGNEATETQEIEHQNELETDTSEVEFSGLEEASIL